MTKIDLQRVLELDQRATTGPWEDDVDEVTQHWSCPEPWATIVSSEVDCGEYCYGGTARGIEKPEDAALIAYYRTAAPDMARALNAVIGAIEVLREDNPRETVLLNALDILEGFIEKHLGEQE